MGRMEMELVQQQRSFLIHHCDILRRMCSLELDYLRLKMEDSLHIRQDKTLMGRYLEL